MSEYTKLCRLLFCSPIELLFCICPRPGCVSSSHCSCKYSPALLCSAFVQESVCQAPLRGLAALETPATKVRCLFLPRLMLQHGPQAVQREPLGGWKKESKHWIKLRTNPTSAADLLWSPLQAVFELIIVFPSSQDPSCKGNEAILTPGFLRLGGRSLQCASGCPGAASPYTEKGSWSSPISFILSFSPSLSHHFSLPFLLPSSFPFFPSLTPLLPSHQSRWAPGRHTGSAMH